MFFSVISVYLQSIQNLQQFEWGNPISTQSSVARPYSASREKVWDMAIRKSNLLPRYLISHVNPVMMSVLAVTKVKLTIFCTCNFGFYCVPAHVSRHFFLSALLMLLISLSTQTEIFLLIRYHVMNTVGQGISIQLCTDHYPQIYQELELPCVLKCWQILVLRGHTEGKGLGHGRRAVYRHALWSA